MQPAHSASGLKAIHLLRALLREASYLPDATARGFFRRYIVNRFRAYQPAANASPSFDARAIEKKRHGFGKRKQLSIIQERAQLAQRRGRKGLNYLRRANGGEHNCLRKILFLAYGRIGKRKYILLEPLLRPDDPTEAPESAPLQKLYYSNERFLSFFDAPKKANANTHNIHISDRFNRLKTTLKSQVQNGIALGRSIKRPHFNTPINNIWERPMPIRRARNNVRKWYAETMTRLLPPLPKDEFDDMQAMIDGRRKVSLVKRRAPALELHTRSEDELPAADRFAKLVHDALVLEKPSKADTFNPRQMDARIMRRMYAKVILFCSKLEWNEGLNKWESVWGRSPGLTHDYNCAAQHDDFFAGVDAKGNLLKGNSKEKQSNRHKTASDEANMEASFSPDPSDDQNAKRKRTPHVKIPFYVDFLPPDHPTRVAADEYFENKGRAWSASGAATPRKAAPTTIRS